MFGKCVEASVRGSRRSKHSGCSDPQGRPLNRQACCPCEKPVIARMFAPISCNQFHCLRVSFQDLFACSTNKLRCYSLHSQKWQQLDRRAAGFCNSCTLNCEINTLCSARRSTENNSQLRTSYPH